MFEYDKYNDYIDNTIEQILIENTLERSRLNVASFLCMLIRQ